MEAGAVRARCWSSLLVHGLDARLGFLVFLCSPLASCLRLSAALRIDLIPEKETEETS